jgi:hypothetical protein
VPGVVEGSLGPSLQRQVCHAGFAKSWNDASAQDTVLWLSMFLADNRDPIVPYGLLEHVSGVRYGDLCRLRLIVCVCKRHQDLADSRWK